MADATDRSLEMEARYRALFETNHSVMLIVDPGDGRILDANLAAARYYGWPVAKLRSMRISEINQLTPDEISAEMRRARAEEKKQFFFRHLLADGRVRDVEVYSGPIQFDGRRVLYSIVHDITDRVAAERSLAESEARFRNLAERSPDGIFIDTGGYFQYVNPMACRLFGASGMGELSGTKVLDRVHPDHVAEFADLFDRGLGHEGEMTDHELVLVRLDGSTFDAEVRTVSIVHWGQPSLLFYVRDITERRRAEKRILFISYHDEMTGLYNRRFYEEESLRLDTPRNLPLSLVVCDVNALKFVNDSFGHARGDELLKTVADTLRRECRADDVVARMGGDEFAVLLPKTGEADAEGLVRRILAALSRETVGTVCVSAAFGFAVKTDPGESFSDVYKTAEDRMYRNKLSESREYLDRTVDRVLASLNEKNGEEGRHSGRVSEIGAAIARKLRLEEPDVDPCRPAGLARDGQVASGTGTGDAGPVD